MTVKEIIEKLDLQCLNEANLDVEVSGAYASDLLSDVRATPVPARYGSRCRPIRTSRPSPP